jgi:ASC-1-like (ASCH) protein
MHHDLKIFDENFLGIYLGLKKAEVRFDDRKFKVGDTITFHAGAYSKGEFKYDGRKVSAEISHIDDFGVMGGYVLLSLDKVGMLICA